MPRMTYRLIVRLMQLGGQQPRHHLIRDGDAVRARHAERHLRLAVRAAMQPKVLGERLLRRHCFLRGSR